jgi:hypothetical protein
MRQIGINFIIQNQEALLFKKCLQMIDLISILSHRKLLNVQAHQHIIL